MDLLQRDQWQLSSPLPMLWRPDGALQLGLEPPAGLVVGGLPRAAARVIEALREPCTGEQLRQLAGAASEDWLPQLIDGLRRAGLLRRSGPAVGGATVIGSGPLALLVVQLLLDAVAEPIRVIWPEAVAPAAALARVQRRHPGRLRFAGQPGAEPSSLPGLTVIAAQAPEPDRSVARQVGERPHLVVCGSDLGVAVGPLVVPGRTACLRCEDLHRTQRDPAWPELLLQLSRPRAGAARPPALHWAASTTVLHAACWLTGALPDSLGASLDLDAGGGLRVRRLRAHPGCGCLAVR